MKTSFTFPVFGLAALALTGCGLFGPPQPPIVVYVNINGMTVPKRCVAYVVYQGTDVQITLPSGGAGGTTVSLGKLGLSPEVLQRATGTLQLCDHARMQCCELERQAAYANDRKIYDRMRKLDAQN